ncbi:MAG: ABC transporter substrate-binding protein [Desertimonas sp.]
MTRRSTRSRWTGAVVALAALAAAGGPVAAGSEDSEPDRTDAAGTAAETAETAEGPARGGTLRYGDAVGPSRFDAHRSTIGQDIRFFTPVYDRLVHFDAAGALVPGLATEWVFGDDGLSFTMTLREGVTFHDGEPFDAAAVQANIERGQTLEGSSIAGDLEPITAIETPDDHTVVLTLDRPYSVLPGLLSHRAGVMISPAAFDDTDLDFAPVGAGPYRVTEYQESSFITYERYEDYWDQDLGGPDRIELQIIPDSQTRFNALRSGQVDLTNITGVQVEEAEQAGLSVDSEPGLTYLVLYLNRANSELGDPLVRQAINHAIDRQAIVDAVLFGAGATAVQQFPEGYFAYNPDYPGDYYAYDPDRARELLAEAGLEDGFEFTMLVTNLDTYMRSGEAVQAYLAEVGITANIELVEAAQTADVYYAQQQGDALLSQWGGRPDPQMTLALQFTDTGFSNPGRHTTPEFMEADAATSAAIDPAEREAALHAEVAVVVEEALQVPIAHDYANFAYNDTVSQFARLITGQPNFPGIEIAQD